MTTAHVIGERLAYNRTIGVTAMFGRGFYYPVDIVGSNAGRLYVLNRSSDGDKRGVRVTMMNLDEDYFGIFGEWGVGDGQFTWPNSIAIDSKSRVLISDDYLNRISLMTAEGEFITKWGAPGNQPGQFDGPNGIAINANDEIFVADHRNHRIQRFTVDGEFISTMGKEGSNDGEFNMPWGVTVNVDGHVIVADWGNDRVQKLTADGQWVASYGVSGNADGELHRPSSACEDDEGYLYVADWGNHRVQVFDPDGGYLQTLRGQATVGKWAQDFLDTNVEEAAARAQSELDLDPTLFEDDAHEQSSHIEKYFWGPSAIKLIDGYCYVVDTVRHRVQVYDLAHTSN